MEPFDVYPCSTYTIDIQPVQAVLSFSMCHKRISSQRSNTETGVSEAEQICFKMSTVLVESRVCLLQSELASLACLSIVVEKRASG